MARTFYPSARALSPTSQRVPGVAVTPIVSASQNSYGKIALLLAMVFGEDQAPTPLPVRESQR